MDYEPLTLEKRDRILEDNATTLMRRIQITPYFMAELVAEKVMDNYQSQEIQAEQTPGKKNNALLEYLQSANLEQFISFCLVLEIKQRRRDIVHDQFGLKLKNLKSQRENLVVMSEDGLYTSLSGDPVVTSGNGLSTSLSEIPYDISSDPESRDNNNSSSATSTQGAMMAAAHGKCEPMGEDGLNQDYEDLMGSGCERLRKTIEPLPHKMVVVALLDTGLYTGHPDLKVIIKEKGNCIGEDDTNMKFIPNAEAEKDLELDEANHGTMSAGILWQYAGEKNVEIHNYKVTTKGSRSKLTDVARALKRIKEWDIRHPDRKVDIILMTFGSSHSDDETDRLLSELGEEKILICSASNEGQSGSETVQSPASHGSVIAVGSCDEKGNRCSHSSVGQSLDFVFPGNNIKSSSSKYCIFRPNSRYGIQSGTSFAAPHGAAFMALILTYVETQCTVFHNKDGTHWRRALTKSSRMKNLMIREFCRGTFEPKRGFGMPLLNRVKVQRIEAFLLEEFP